MDTSSTSEPLHFLPEMISNSDPLDAVVLLALIDQVAAAVPAGGTELDVTTRISRPMWRRFCRAAGFPLNSEPTEWIGPHKTRRVFGSRTIIIESNLEFATCHRSR